MALDWGYPIVGFVLAYIFAVSYKKKTGKDVSTLWKDREQKKIAGIEIPEYRKVYITRGIKQ